MARTSAFISAASDLLSTKDSIMTSIYTKHTIKNKAKMIQILKAALFQIEEVAAKYGVSQFIGLTEKRVQQRIAKVARLEFNNYLEVVKQGATLPQQRAFVKKFSLPRNRRAIKAAAKQLSA